MSRNRIRPSGIGSLLCQTGPHSVNVTGWPRSPRDVTSAPGGVAGSALLTPRYNAGLTPELSARLPLVSQVAPRRSARSSRILLVALEVFDRDTLRPADE